MNLLASDNKGRIFDIRDLGPAGMKAGRFFSLPEREFIKLPAGSRLFMLPQRAPVGHDPATGEFKAVKNYFAVAAFISPAYTATYNSAYQEIKKPSMLPLFCYSACAFHRGGFYVTAVRVDKSDRHDPQSIDVNLVIKNVKKIKRMFSGNRLIRHLGDCALAHGCPGAQNFFLSREECPLPVSPRCNASCAGCISIQTQPRIKFVPTPEEIAETALFHAGEVRDPVLSFGQGCEGEPLLQSAVIEKSIRLIRRATDKGTININTNASLPEAIGRLFDAGLDSVRVSMNSARGEYYNRYYKPKGYSFKDVMKSINTAKRKNGFVSVNYLTMPGFTDSRDEFAAFRKFVESRHIDMIQWRNLNFDPRHYFKIMKLDVVSPNMLGVRDIMNRLKRDFPRLRMGYYNPSLAKDI